MKKVMVVLACCCVAAWTSGGESPPAAINRLVGLWKLVRIEVRQPGGGITTDPDFGPRAVGYIFYDSTGHMGVQLMNPDRPKWKYDDQPTPEETRTSAAGFEAYSGTYEVHAGDGVVIHHLELSFIPNVVGQEWRRRFQVSGDQLRLTPPPFKSFSGEVLDETLIWERVRPE